ncbi:hypothetical protein EMCLV039R [Equine molluscum contagiosum-like virus]|nr:hypothetical protein EMCLV039R [Equine molluscum contagiosum-like virus]
MRTLFLPAPQRKLKKYTQDKHITWTLVFRMSFTPRGPMPGESATLGLAELRALAARSDSSADLARRLLVRMYPDVVCGAPDAREPGPAQLHALRVHVSMCFPMVADTRVWQRECEHALMEFLFRCRLLRHGRAPDDMLYAGSDARASPDSSMRPLNLCLRAAQEHCPTPPGTPSLRSYSSPALVPSPLPEQRLLMEERAQRALDAAAAAEAAAAGAPPPCVPVPVRAYGASAFAQGASAFVPAGAPAPTFAPAGVFAAPSLPSPQSSLMAAPVWSNTQTVVTEPWSARHSVTTLNLHECALAAGSAAEFAALLLRKIFPDLFDARALGRHYSCYGDACTAALEPARLHLVRHCVSLYFPAVREDAVWLAHCVRRLDLELAGLCVSVLGSLDVRTDQEVLAAPPPAALLTETRACAPAGLATPAAAAPVAAAPAAAAAAAHAAMSSSGSSSRGTASGSAASSVLSPEACADGAPRAEEDERVPSSVSEDEVDVPLVAMSDSEALEAQRGASVLGSLSARAARERRSRRLRAMRMRRSQGLSLRDFNRLPLPPPPFAVPNFVCLPTRPHLRRMYEASRSIANFASRLLVHIFPELFTSEHLRLHYNCTGSVGKRKLDPVRLRIVRHYVTLLYPAARSECVWNARFVPALDERCRRRSGALRKQGPRARTPRHMRPPFLPARDIRVTPPPFAEPTQGLLSAKRIKELARESESVGEFTVKLAKLLFPEFFTRAQDEAPSEDYGRPLDPVRMQIVKHYVRAVTLESALDSVWEEQCLPSLDKLVRQSQASDAAAAADADADTDADPGPDPEHDESSDSD